MFEIRYTYRAGRDRVRHDGKDVGQARLALSAPVDALSPAAPAAAASWD